MNSAVSLCNTRVLIPGRADGPALILDEPLSFWGGFDPRTGTIIDVHHPQRGEKLTARIVFIPASRGSAGTPGGIAETLRNATGPAAFVLGQPDLNIAAGVLVANRLYGFAVPVVAMEAGRMREFAGVNRISIDQQGRLQVAG